jgi:hypothetical protein
MAGLMNPQTNSSGSKTSQNNCNSHLEGSAVYIRYKDHVLFKNIQQPVPEAVERETIGWLTKQTDEIFLVEHDRTMQNGQLPCGQGNGLILLKSCILEIKKLPLQKNSNCTLNSQENNIKAEYALQPKKRKTPKRNRTGANK